MGMMACSRRAASSRRAPSPCDSRRMRAARASRHAGRPSAMKAFREAWRSAHSSRLRYTVSRSSATAVKWRAWAKQECCPGSRPAACRAERSTTCNASRVHRYAAATHRAASGTAAGLTWLPSATPMRFWGLPRELKTPYGKFCSGKWLPGSTAMNDWDSAMPGLYDSQMFTIGNRKEGKLLGTIGLGPDARTYPMSVTIYFAYQGAAMRASLNRISSRRQI